MIKVELIRLIAKATVIDAVHDLLVSSIMEHKEIKDIQRL